MGVDEFKNKYLNRLDAELGSSDAGPVSSRQYKEFKSEYMPKHLSLYEKACRFAGNLLKVSPGKKNKEECCGHQEVFFKEVKKSKFHFS